MNRRNSGYFNNFDNNNSNNKNFELEYYSLLGKVSKNTNAFFLKKDDNNYDSNWTNNSRLDSYTKTNKNKLVFKPLSVSNSLKLLKNNNSNSNNNFNKFSLKKKKFPLTKKDIINFLENDKKNNNNYYYFSSKNSTYKKEKLKDEIITNLMSKNLFKHKLNNNKNLFKDKTKQMYGFRSFNKNYNNHNNNNKNKDNFYKSTITNSNKFYNF